MRNLERLLSNKLKEAMKSITPKIRPTTKTTVHQKEEIGNRMAVKEKMIAKA